MKPEKRQEKSAENEPLINLELSNSWRSEDQNLYSEKRFSLGVGEVICLIGCNGAGKSTLLEQITQDLVKKGYENCVDAQNPFLNFFREKEESVGYVLRFKEGFHIPSSEETSLIEAFAKSSQSTGEGLKYELASCVKLLGQYVKKAAEESKPLILLFDDCDVGTSIDVQDEIVSFVNMIRNDLIERKIKHNIILAANSYELCRTFRCVDCNTLEEKALSSYEEYKEFVLSSRRRKDERNKEEKE